MALAQRGPAGEVGDRGLRGGAAGRSGDRGAVLGLVGRPAPEIAVETWIGAEPRPLYVLWGEL